MMFGVLTMAFAAEPTLVDDGTLVHRVDWARPFQLQRPHPYRYQREFQDIDKGWVVQLEVEAWTMLPTVAPPNLWVGDKVAGRLNWGRTRTGATCALFWVPGDVDMVKTPVFFGSTTPADQIDTARREATVKAAAKLPKLTERRDLTGEPIAVEDFRALRDQLRGRCAAGD